MKTPTPHLGSEFANKTLEWLPTDTKENYEKLIKDPAHVQYFIDMGWDQPMSINYKFNSQGFRCEEFDGGPYLMALGCSYTVGIGLPIEVTWPYRVGQKLNLKPANLAWGGYSTDTCYRLAEYWIPILRPDYVVMLSPPKKRVELLLDSSMKPQFEVFLPQSNSPLFLNSEYLKHWFLNDANADINQRKNHLALKKLCDEYEIPCMILDAEQYMSASREQIGYARDYMHGGPAAHEIISDKAIEFYKSL